jgi:DNA-binding NtrC family response regulator
MSPQCQCFLSMPALICGRAMEQVMRTVERVAPSGAAVLILGESGVGKEIVARALHEYSPRKSRPWVDVNVAALPEHLMESELFGYDKGAFSGADSTKPGLFELANAGTLFLDEVGELGAKMQVKLLRVLDGVPYYRLGGVRKVSVDVRIVTATNRNLEQAIREGKLRSDLYHRLTQVQIHVPPLRERTEEILPLAEFFLGKSNPRLTMSEPAQKALLGYPWPGNLRELKNVVTRCAMLCESDRIDLADLPEQIRGGSPSSQRMNRYRLDALEQQTIDEVLSLTGGHQERAADMLGISRRTLSRKLKAYAADNALQPSVA